jgi:tRNA-modifying protein YgfZ
MFSHDQYDALVSGAGLLDRRSRGRLQLTGADRRSYLQGLLTNEIAALSPGQGCYAALLTAQGRMLSDMRVSELGDRILIDLPAATAESVRQRLADFIFSEDVDVRDVGNELGQLGIYGPGTTPILASVLSPSSLERLEQMQIDANQELRLGDTAVIVVRSDDYGAPGFEMFVSASEVARLSDAVRAAGARDVTAEAVEVTRVEAGRPEFGADMDEHTIPLEAGIEARAISYTKGCYVGQEVIIRVLHRGQGRVAKRLVGLLGTDADGPLVRGTRIEAENKPIGTITSAAHSPRLRRPIALGYVHRDSAEPGTVLQVTGAPGGSSPRNVTVVTTPFIRPPAAQ